MLVSLTVGKVDAGVAVLLTPDKRLIEFPSILLPPDISSGSIVDITVSQNISKEAIAQRDFQTLQQEIYSSFGAEEPSTPVLRCRNATQTSVVLEWDPIELATADLLSLSLFRNGQKAGNIPRPLDMHSTKISGLAVDTEYSFHLVLRTTAGTFASEKVTVRTHKMTDLSGITITTGVMPPSVRDNLTHAVDRIGAKIVEGVRIDTTHFVTTEGRGQAWEKAVEQNIPVVRPEWVDHCEKNGRILGVTKFYLDAMRPGPAFDESPMPSPLPPVPEQSAPARSSYDTVPPKTPRQIDDDDDDDDRQGEEEDDEDEGEENGEAQDKEKEKGNGENGNNEAQEEETDKQKVRFDDPTTLRPKRNNSKKTSQEGSGNGDDNDAEGEGNNKPAVTPDRTSFQEVAL